MMGRTAGPPTATKDGKGPASKTGKASELTKGVKRQQKRPVSATTASTTKKKTVVSKPGYTVYSEKTAVPKAKEKSGIGNADKAAERQTQVRQLKDDHPEGTVTEVATQMQVEEERAKASSQALSLHIPTAGQEDSTFRSEQGDFVGSTPFNKRLVSSTPDPERLQALDGNHGVLHQTPVRLQNSTSQRPIALSSAGDESLQLIPERDGPVVMSSASLAGPIFPPEALASVASGISERIKRQRDTNRPHTSASVEVTSTSVLSKPHNKQSGKEQNHSHANMKQAGKSIPNWKRKHKKWEEELTRYKNGVKINPSQPTDRNSPFDLNSKDFDESQTNSNVAPSTPNLITKAEWVSDTSTSGHSNSKLNFKSSAFVPVSVPVPASNKVSNSATVITPRFDSYVSNTLTQRSNNSQPHSSLASENKNEYSMSPPVSTPSHRSVSSSEGIQTYVGVTAAHTKGGMVSTESTHLSPVITELSTLHSLSVKTTSLHAQTATVNSFENKIKMSEAVVGPVSHPFNHLNFKPSTLPKESVNDSNNQSSAHRIGSIPVSQVIAKPTVKQSPNKYTSVSRSPVATRSFNSSSDSCDVEVGSLSSPKTGSNKDTQRGKENSLNNHTEKPGETDGSIKETQRGKMNSQNNHTEKLGGTNSGEALEDTSFLSGIISKLKAPPILALTTGNNRHAGIDSDSSIHDSPRKNQQPTSTAAAMSEHLKEIMALYLPNNTTEATTGTDRDTGIFSTGFSASGGMSGHFDQANAEKSSNSLMSNGDGQERMVMANGESAKEEKSNTNQNNNGDANIGETNVNQNYHNYSSGDDYYEQPRGSKRGRNLFYLEGMSDPTLKEIACRLAFKATALRDIELRDLIDDMIFHTDAALGHEGARYQSKMLFLQEENSKLKKRLHNVNRQLDAKERQEKMAATSVYANNDMLQLERKLVFLRQEKDRLDHQVTALLEDKSKWLITQQDLIKTISLKDHEIIKLDERHQQDMTRLHQSLNQATQNSQGVHHKLSVADKEISNMEQRLKCRDLDIADLKEKLRQAEMSVTECRQHLATKDLEMRRLQDLIDTLKMGVDNVLSLYESSEAGHAPTPQQRQGIDSLRRMAHPERFASTARTDWQTGMQASHAEAFRDQQVLPPVSSMQASLSEAYRNQQDLPHVSSIQASQVEAFRDQQVLHPGLSMQASQAGAYRNQHLSGTYRPPEYGYTSAVGTDWQASYQAPRSESYRSQQEFPPGSYQPPGYGQATSRSLPDPALERSTLPSYNNPNMSYPNSSTYPYSTTYASIERPNQPQTVPPMPPPPHVRPEPRYPPPPHEPEWSSSRVTQTSTKPSSSYQSWVQQRMNQKDKEWDRERAVPGGFWDKHAIGRKERHRDEKEKRLTPAALEEHNQRLSPIDRRLWRSMQDEPTEVAAEPYYSDSEYELNHRNSRHMKRKTTPKSILKKRDIAISTDDMTNEAWEDDHNHLPENRESHQRQRARRKSEGDVYSGSRNSRREPSRHYRDNQSQMRSWQDPRPEVGPEHSRMSEYIAPPQYPRRQEDGGNQSTKHSSLRSETISKANGNSEKSSPATVGTQYSTIRSRSLSLEDLASPETVDNRPCTEASEVSIVRGHLADGLAVRLDAASRNFQHSTPKRSHGGRTSNGRRSLSADYPTSRSHANTTTLHTLQPDPSDHQHSYQQTSSRNENQLEFMKKSKPSSSEGRAYREHCTSCGVPSRDFGASSGATRGSNYPPQSSPLHMEDLSMSRRATMGGDDATQREFFQGTQLSASVSSIEDDNSNAATLLEANNNGDELTDIEQDPFTTGIASLDIKIANLQKKIDRAKAIFS